MDSFLPTVQVSTETGQVHILALVIMLETGEVGRFAGVGNFAVRYDDRAKRFYQRKAAKSGRAVAIKAVAHKLARACFYVMRDQVPFDSERCFG